MAEPGAESFRRIETETITVFEDYRPMTALGFTRRCQPCQSEVAFRILQLLPAWDFP
jgi:hypothetical protein